MSLTLFAGGCASVQPEPLAARDLLEVARADRQAVRAEVPPLPAALTLEEAIARA